MKAISLKPQKEVKRVANFLKTEFRKRKKKRAILALSGGIDSALCASLVKKAGLEIYAVILPYYGRGKDGEKIARELRLSKDHIIRVDIGNLVDKAIKEIEKAMKLDKIDKGNIMARERMVVQYALARKMNGLVIGTENLSEYYLGYFTLHGDQACDISPISHLWKTQVRELAKYLKLPSWVIEKTPTAGLWPGQTDEGEFGFSYADADKVLYLSVIKKYPEKRILKELKLPPKLVKKVIQRVKETEYKRGGAPKILI